MSKKMNKTGLTADILGTIKDHMQSCTKLQLDNIIFPKWSDLGLFGQIVSQTIKTKEQPAGCSYDEMRFQVVMRILGGKVFMTGGRPDAYAWTLEKVEKMLSKARPIGVNSPDGVINLSKAIESIPDYEEKRIFADMFCNLKKDLLLITTPPENRTCVEITQELYDAGITCCIDEWMDPDENGLATVTELNVGDFLIVTDKGVYCIRRDEFMETHTFA